MTALPGNKSFIREKCEKYLVLKISLSFFITGKMIILNAKLQKSRATHNAPSGMKEKKM